MMRKAKTTQEAFDDFRKAADAFGVTVKEAIEPVLNSLCDKLNGVKKPKSTANQEPHKG